jgi:hypothetical protein
VDVVLLFPNICHNLEIFCISIPFFSTKLA